MATLTRRPVYREVLTEIDGRRLIIGIHPNGWITVRLKGTQRTAEVPATWLYRNRLGIAAYQERQVRRRARKGAKAAAIEAQARMIDGGHGVGQRSCQTSSPNAK